MIRHRILVTVKTYPTLSRKYGETVCTAGVQEDGSWVRLYPVPFRRLDEQEQYKKYDWIECGIDKRTADPRPESYCPVDPSQLEAVDHMGTQYQWRDRRKLLLKTARVYTRLGEIIRGAKANDLSLAVFKPAEILGFQWEEEEREWDPAKVDKMRMDSRQRELFAEDAWRETFRLVRKVPYSFSYLFKDADGQRSKLKLFDWEAGALFWNCMRGCGDDEPTALEKVRAKYLDEFCQKDLHFFLGTTLEFHSFAPNPWVIIGVFPVPHETQMELL